MNRGRLMLGFVASALVTLVIVAQVIMLAARHTATATPTESAQGSQASGTMVDERGRAVAGVVVKAAGEQTTSGRDGRFTLPLDRPALAVVSAPGHLSRGLALQPGVDTTVPLTSGSTSTVSLRLGGDVMLGRGYYEDRGEDEPLLSPSSSAQEHADVFGSVEPLLKDSDLSAVTLAMPLLKDPEGVGTDVQRRADLHPSKLDVRAGSTEAAAGLALAGVDVVSLANDHVMDGLDAGLDSTIEALDTAGVAHFGAGRTVDEAWQPALMWTRGQAVAFLGCTTVTEADTTIPVVAGDGRAGAAECDADRLQLEVLRARLTASTVVVMLHGGQAEQRAQLPDVREYARVAREAGAGVVVGAHPGVLGGLSADESGLFAESLGSLAHDEESWAAVPSALLRVDLRQGRPVSASADPLVVDKGLPKPAMGAMAPSIARLMASGLTSPARLAGPGSRAQAFTSSQPARVAVGLEAGEVRRLSPGWWYDASTGAARLRTGTDLLYGTGDFERMEQGRDSLGAPLWSLGKNAELTSEAACGAGNGIRLSRTPLSTEPAIATPTLRTPVTPGAELTLMTDLKQASEGSQLEVHWYRAMQGPSSETTTIDLPQGAWDADTCRQVSRTVTVPTGAVAAKVYVKLLPPEGGQRVRKLAVDNVVLVEWSAIGQGGRRDEYVEASRDTSVAFVADERISAGTTPLR